MNPSRLRISQSAHQQEQHQQEQHQQEQHQQEQHQQEQHQQESYRNENHSHSNYHLKDSDVGYRHREDHQVYNHWHPASYDRLQSKIQHQPTPLKHFAGLGSVAFDLVMLILQCISLLCQLLGDIITILMTFLFSHRLAHSQLSNQRINNSSAHRNIHYRNRDENEYQKNHNRRIEGYHRIRTLPTKQPSSTTNDILLSNELDE
jgi:cation transport ATPase